MHIKNASPFLKAETKDCSVRSEGGETMFTLSKKKKAMIAATAAIALVLMVAMLYTAYAEPSSTSEENLSRKVVVLKARGIALEKIDNQTVKMPANLTLYCEPVKEYKGVIGFRIVNGTVEVNATTYTITEGKGLVIQHRHAIALQAKGTGSDGQTVTLKLAGRYFWMWGHLYVARLRGVLRVGDTKLLLLLRAAAKVP